MSIADETGSPHPGTNPLKRLVWAEAMLKSVRDDPLAFLAMTPTELGASLISLRETMETAQRMLKHLGGAK